jgi:hypothetical protein
LRRNPGLRIRTLGTKGSLSQTIVIVTVD